MPIIRTKELPRSYIAKGRLKTAWNRADAAIFNSDEAAAWLKAHDSCGEWELADD